MQLIRSRAVALYFRPFATVKLEKMAAAFGWTIGETECEVVRLIGEGDIKGRVDRLGKVLGKLGSLGYMSNDLRHHRF